MANRYAERALQQVRGTSTPTSAPAPRSTLGRSAINSVRPKPAPVEPEEDKSWVEKYAPTIARIGLPILGGAIGSIVPVGGTAAGAAAGAAIGGAIGGGLGEVAAEKLEGRDLDAKEIALSAGLSAIPAGPAGRMAGKLATEAAKTGISNLGKRAALHAVEGAAQGALAETVSPFVREGRAPTMEEIGRGAAFGTVLGGALGTGADLAGNALVRRPVDVAPVEAPPPVVDAPPVAPVEPVAPPLPREWEGTPPPEFAPADVTVPRTPAEVAADQLRAKGIPETWRTVRRPDELLNDVAPLPDLGPSPSAGYGRGGRPVEKTPPLVTEQPLQEPGVAFTEQTPLPRDGDRRQVVAPVTGFERRLAQRRTEYAQKWGLPEEHPAVVDFMAAHTEARTDALTSLPNKRAWMEDLLPSVRPEDHVVVVDMSKLKPINDKLGHGAGDTAIKTFSGVVAEVFGKEAARIGGDELAAVLRNVNREQAEAIVEKFRQAAANRPTKLRNAKTGETVDIPGYEAHIGVGKSFDEADAAANAAAEASRKGGRGDVPVVHGEPDPSGNPPVPATPAPPVAGLGDRPGVAPGGAAPDPPQTTVPKRFDREAAIARLYSRGTQANDLGSAAAQGAGVLQDLAEIGASFVEEYAQRNKGKLVAFDSWARAAFKALKDVVPNVRKYLRQIYDEAVGLWNKTGVTFGSLPNEPRGVVMGSLGGALQPPGGGPSMPPPKMPKVKTPEPTSPQPLPPGTVVKGMEPDVPKAPEPEPLGRPMVEGEAPRVEAKVDQLREADPKAKLSRDTKRSWESLDPQIRQKLDDVTANPEKEAALYERARAGKVDDVDVQTLDALVAGKRQKYDEARQQLLKAQAEGKDSGPDSVQYLSAALDEVAADLARAARSDVEAGTKLARALAARARVMQAKVSATDPDTFLRRVFREIPEVSDKQAAELVRVLREQPHRLGDALHAAMTPRAVDKWLEAWKAGLVSAPGTQIANLAGNVGEQEIRVGETAIAAVLDSLIGGPRTRMAGEAGWELAGQLAGVRRGFGNLKQALRDIATLAPEKIDLTQPLERQVGAIGGKAGRVVRIPFRLLSAFDDMFKSIGGEAELYKRAYRSAKGDTAKAEKLIARDANGVPALLSEVSGIGDEIKANVLERVFQDPQKMATVIQSARNQYKLLHAVVPFAQMPTSIFSRTLERSPFGAVAGLKAYRAYKSAVASGADAATIAKLKGEAVDKLARPVAGTLILGAFAGLAKAGGMTGGGPTDPKDRNALRDSGWQPYSFKATVNGKAYYIPYNRFEPVSSLLGFAADMVEAGDAKQSGDLFDKALGSIAQNLTSKTYLQGLADAAEAINDPKQFMGQYVTNLAGTVVPNIVAKGAQAVDPTFRDVRPEDSGIGGIPERIGKTIASRLPVVSKTLPARRSGTGGVIERAGSAVTRLLSPVQPSADKEGGDFNRFLVDIDAVPSAPGRDLVVKGKRVRLSEEEYRAIQDADEKTTASLRRSLPRLMKTDPEKARNVIRSAYDQARATARRRVMVSPGFRTRAREVAK